MNLVFISVEGEWLAKYVRDELGRIYDCFLEEVTKEFGVAKLLGSDVYMIKVRIRSSL